MSDYSTGYGTSLGDNEELGHVDNACEHAGLVAARSAELCIYEYAKFVDQLKYDRTN